MSRRWIQSLAIVLVFLAAFVAVTLLGIWQGQDGPARLSEGLELKEKKDWQEAIPNLSDTSLDPTVYVTNSGTKYHLSPDCSALKRAKEVIGTPRSAAIEDGKEPCSICEKG